MDLVGAWLRQLLRAGTAAAIVPAAMLAALVVVLVGAGGLGGLGSITQLVSGPEISPAEQVAAAAPDGSDLADVPPPAAAPPPRAGTGERQPAPQASDRPADRSPGASLQPPRRPRPPAAAVPTPQDAAPPQDATPPPAAPAGRPTLKQGTRRLVEGVNVTVGEVGTVVREVINRLQQTVEGLTPPPPRLR